MFSVILWIITFAMIFRWLVLGGRRVTAWKIDRHASSPATLKQYEDIDRAVVNWAAAIIVVQFVHTVILFF